MAESLRAPCALSTETACGHPSPGLPMSLLISASCDRICSFTNTLLMWFRTVWWDSPRVLATSAAALPVAR